MPEHKVRLILDYLTVCDTAQAEQLLTDHPEIGLTISTHVPITPGFRFHCGPKDNTNGHPHHMTPQQAYLWGAEDVSARRGR